MGYVEDLKAIEILEHLKQILFQDHEVWAGYRKRDFTKALKELYDLEIPNNSIEKVTNEN